jgi:hypothetical protein
VDGGILILPSVGWIASGIGIVTGVLHRRAGGTVTRPLAGHLRLVQLLRHPLVSLGCQPFPSARSDLSSIADHRARGCGRRPWPARPRRWHHSGRASRGCASRQCA